MAHTIDIGAGRQADGTPITWGTYSREQEWHADLGLVDGDTVGGEL